MRQIGGYTVAERAPFLKVKCTYCGAGPRVPCKSESGQDSMPHKARVERARKAARAGVAS